MAFKMADTPRTIRVYNLSSDTGEFIGAGDAFIPAGTGLPAHTTHIRPPKLQARTVALFINDAWQVVADHRGKTAWHKETRQSQTIGAPGELNTLLTFESPQSAFDIWDGKQWVKDEDAERLSVITRNEEQKSTLMKEASVQIAILEDAQNLGIATEEELKQLASWKVYRVKLNRIATGGILDTKLPATPV